MLSISAFVCFDRLQSAFHYPDQLGQYADHPAAEFFPGWIFLKAYRIDSRTLVVIPSMFNDLKELEELVENLEVRFLANRGPNIHFALLTDFKDSKTEISPEEQDLLRIARNKIEELNTKYGNDNNELFFIFHRPRKYNAKEKVWMGYERKRGKLSEMNALLRGRGKGKILPDRR